MARTAQPGGLVTYSEPMTIASTQITIARPAHQ
jgi:hypothetical protein